jgi:uncharacterized membrane-anchored protein YhcB (DUF1043 family)
MSDKRFTTNARIAMGQEFISSLPPASLIKNASQTYMIVHNYMASVLQGAIANEQAKSSSQSKVKETSSSTTDKTSVDRKEYASASNKTDESRGRGKMAKTSGTPAKRGSKKS